MEETPIQKFYKGANVFITGSTGFMGKMLVEKLLRTTEVDSLYLLIREKKGKTIHVRIDELFDDVIFDRLKKENPKYRHKVEVISGDCSLSGLDMSIKDRQILISKVNVVFHVAATVRFDEHLKVAYYINVNATKEVLDLARQMTNLKSIVYVSTAYSHCPREEIEEKFYECPVYYDDVKAVLDKMSKSEAELLTPRIIGKWPNTYTFTKALAESLIKDIGGGLPLAVFRPSIVISTYKEPIEGWVDNWYGPTGVTAGAIAGILRVLYCNEDKVADVVPVDTCVAALIATAWDVSTKTQEQSSEILVYNYVSSQENPVTWKEMIELNIIQEMRYPSITTLWECFVVNTNNFYAYIFLTFLLQIIPGLFIDLFALLTGNKSGMIKIYKKINKLSMVLSYFSTRSWVFSNKNTRNLWAKLDERDKELFPFSMTTVHWMIFFRNYIKGIRQYLLNDPDSTLESAKRRRRWFQVANTIVKFLLVYFLCNFIFKTLSFIFSLVF